MNILRSYLNWWHNWQLKNRRRNRTLKGSYSMGDGRIFLKTRCDVSFNEVLWNEPTFRSISLDSTFKGLQIRALYKETEWRNGTQERIYIEVGLWIPLNCASNASRWNKIVRDKNLRTIRVCNKINKLKNLYMYFPVLRIRHLFDPWTLIRNRFFSRIPNPYGSLVIIFGVKSSTILWKLAQILFFSNLEIK